MFAKVKNGVTGMWINVEHSAFRVRREAFSDFCDFNVPTMSEFKLPA